MAKGRNCNGAATELSLVAREEIGGKEKGFAGSNWVVAMTWGLTA